MTDTDYAPFPEQELRDFAAATPAIGLRTAILNAIACHDALRERCLTAEMQLGQLRIRRAHAPETH